MKLKEQCQKPNCFAPFKSEMTIGNCVIRSFECGHIETLSTDEIKTKQEREAFIASTINVSDKEITIDDEIARFEYEGAFFDHVNHIEDRFYSFDKEKCAYPYQRECVKFVEDTNYKVLIADGMGVGKTIEALLSVKGKESLFPLLILPKQSITLQWCHEIKDWLNNHPIGVMPIMNRASIIPGFKIYVMSKDLLSKKDVFEKMKSLGIKTIIGDECQDWKNPSSKRTIALIKFIEENRIENRIFLSGTPIKNRANEYFTILNLIDPKTFHSYASFCRTWLIPNEKGVYSRIDPHMLDRFKELTSRYIIRREIDDVLKDLPPLRRDFQHIEIDDPVIKGIYNSELDLFSNFLNSAQSMNMTQMLGWLARMRSITGQAKIPWCIERVTDFLEQTENSMAIGIHHHAVRDRLFYHFQQALGYAPLKLSGEDDVYQKNRVQRQFNDGENRLLILNAIAGGVGLNLQSCSNTILLERQWNSADEDQYFARFRRDGQKKSVLGTIPIAVGTIDQWFHNMVEKIKRPIFNETMGSESFEHDLTSDSTLIRELAEQTVSHKL